MFKPAQRTRLKARVALAGPAGSGKTYTALLLASHLVPGGRIALLDTEGHSAVKYALPEGGTPLVDGFVFDVMELDEFSPDAYVAAIREAEQAQYDVLILDSLSHAWMGKKGVLEMVDRIGARERNSFTAWRTVTPKHNALVDTMLRCKMHLIATMRTKTKYVLEEQERKGRTTSVPKKVGMEAIQREGMDFEFDIVGDMAAGNVLTITKSRCPAVSDEVFEKPGKDLADIISTWLNVGSPTTPEKQPETAPDAVQEVAAPQTPATQEAPCTEPDWLRWLATAKQLKQEAGEQRYYRVLHRHRWEHADSMNGRNGWKQTAGVIYRILAGLNETFAKERFAEATQKLLDEFAVRNQWPACVTALQSIGRDPFVPAQIVDPEERKKVIDTLTSALASLSANRGQKVPADQEGEAPPAEEPLQESDDA